MWWFSITNEEMGFQRCWVVINHDVGEVVMVEEAKVIVVEETNERLATGKKIGGGCLFVNFRP